MNNYQYNQGRNMPLMDKGGKPYVINIKRAAEMNDTYRTAIWTGKYLQTTVMSIPAGSDVGLEIHPEVDQMIVIAKGQGYTMMGPEQNNLNFRMPVQENDAIYVPAGIWHNVINAGYVPLKIVTTYAPPEHPFGTVHKTKQDAIESEMKY
jgi:mannose-6-phosphate isomerase-like protein (cupin superfamily)